MKTLPSKTFIFEPSHLFWDEVSFIVEYCSLRWLTNCNYNSLSSETQISGIRVPCIVLHQASMLLHPCVVGGIHGKGIEKIEFSESSPKSLQGGIFRADYSNVFSSIRLQQIVFGHAFEKARVVAEQKYGLRRSWPSLLEFSYHVRNGSFHKNQFNFTRPILGSPAWRGTIISSTLQGTPVMGSFLGLGDIPVLLYELSMTI